MFGVELIVPTIPFPVVALSELYAGLEEDFGYVVDESKKVDLATEAEKLNYEWSMKHYGHELLFVTEYGTEKRAFYHMRNENGVPEGYDLMWCGVEITTGVQREHRYEVLKTQAKEKGLDEGVKFYLEFFKYGCPPRQFWYRCCSNNNVVGNLHQRSDVYLLWAQQIDTLIHV